MTAIVTLFAIGAVLLAAEVFVPGGILGVAAAIALIAGVVLAFVDYGSAGGWIAVASALGLTLVTVSFELVVLPRTALGRRLFLKAEIGGTSQPPVAESASIVGQAGTTDTVLAPSGYVLVGGKRHEAFSRSGMIARGEAVRVVGMDNFRLIVQKN